MGVKRQNKRTKWIWDFFLVTLLVFIISLVVYFAFGGGKYSVGDFVSRLMNNNQNDSFVLKLDSDVQVNVYGRKNYEELVIEAELEQQIYNFFRLRYSRYGELSTADYSQIYTYSSADLVFDEAVHDYLTRQRKSSTIDLSFTQCDVSLKYESAAYAGNNIAEVRLSESFTTAFSGLGGIVSTYHGIEHFFTFNKSSGYWKIDRHQESSRVYDYMNEVLDGLLEKENLRRADISRIYMEDYAKIFLEKLESNSYKYKAKKEIPDFEYPYQRDLAADYALVWTSHERTIRNKTEFYDYNDNSVNFTSQCVFAGGIPMDSQGNRHWKWYDKKRDFSNEKKGYSDSWIDGGDFYDYITNNTGFGMVARVSTKTQMEIGDIIQFARATDSGNDKIYYQCIVTGKKENELLLTANGDDIRNFPMSAIGLNFIRPIKIYGYNTT